MPTKIAVLEKCHAALENNCDDPAAELIKTGKTLIAIGKAVKGLSLSETRSCLVSVAQREIAGTQHVQPQPTKTTVRA